MPALRKCYNIWSNCIISLISVLRLYQRLHKSTISCCLKQNAFVFNIHSHKWIHQIIEQKRSALSSKWQLFQYVWNILIQHTFHFHCVSVVLSFPHYALLCTWKYDAVWYVFRRNKKKTIWGFPKIWYRKTSCNITGICTIPVFWYFYLIFAVSCLYTL